MRFNSPVRKFEVGLVAVVAAVAVVLEVAFVFSPFAAEDFSIATPTSEDSTKTPTPVGADSYPVPPEPALRTLDGVVYHG
jgi:hypothetical protein